jgi:hypothetical protein
VTDYSHVAYPVCTVRSHWSPRWRRFRSAPARRGSATVMPCALRRPRAVPLLFRAFPGRGQGGDYGGKKGRGIKTDGVRKDGERTDGNCNKALFAVPVSSYPVSSYPVSSYPVPLCPVLSCPVSIAAHPPSADSPAPWRSQCRRRGPLCRRARPRGAGRSAPGRFRGCSQRSGRCCRVEQRG